MKEKKVDQSVCFVLTHVPNPRINKRISAFKRIMPVNVICARRISQNIWEPEHNDVKHIILDIDLPQSDYIFKRMWISLGYRKKMYRLLIQHSPSIVYAEGLDTLLVAEKYKKNFGSKLIFEVSDLRESYIEKPHGIIRRIMTILILACEKKLFKSVDKLVITSPRFFDMHYYKLISKENTLFIPNVPDLSAFQNYRSKKGGTFTVGFIGGIRYLNQMKMLVDASSELDINVIFAGAGGTIREYAAIKNYCGNRDNVKFVGRYDYKKDISNLYGMIDCVYSVYNADNPNVRIALPNKLYEAIICGIPIIVAKGTYLEKVVNEWGVGISINHKDASELKSVLEKLKDDRNYYKAFVDMCEKKKADIIAMCEFSQIDELLKAN